MKIICKPCKAQLLIPSPSKRMIEGVGVYSLYDYDEIDTFLKYKHQAIGARVYQSLADYALSPFLEQWQLDTAVAVVAVDDHVRHDFSHSAAISLPFRSQQHCHIRYGVLKATSTQHYASQTLQYRMMHPRNFLLKPFPEEAVILVDDIITTGETLRQAIATMRAASKEVLFAVTLASVKL